MEPTKTEILLRQTFQELYQPIITDHLFCFHCGNHYSVAGMGSRPEKCRVPTCQKTWDVGEVAYPDIIIEWYSWVQNSKMEKRTGVIRVDGYELHNRSKQAINRDFHQVQNFREHDIRVFIAYNTELTSQEARREFAKRVITMMQASDKDYQSYFEGIEMRERVRKLR